MKSWKRRWCLVTLVLVLAGVTFEQHTDAQAPSASRRYRIIDLGTLGGTFSRARAINNHGEIAGESLLPDDGDVTAFYWQAGEMRQLLPYVPGSSGSSSGAAINNSGVVVGFYDPSQFPPNPPAQSFRYDPSTDTVGFLPGNSAWDINDAGQILARGSGGEFFIVGGADLPNFSAHGLNAGGEVVGAGTAIGAGSLIASHVNDGGFWLVKEYLNMSVPQTVATWTVLETIISVAGLAGVLVLGMLVG